MISGEPVATTSTPFANDTAPHRNVGDLSNDYRARRRVDRAKVATAERLDSRQDYSALRASALRAFAATAAWISRLTRCGIARVLDYWGQDQDQSVPHP